MPVPWLSAIRLAIGIVDVVRRRKAASPDEAVAIRSGRRGASFDAADDSLAGVVEAAVQQALSRDAARVELERERLDAERERAARADRLAAVRQAGDRELSRLRLLTVVAAAGWIGTLVAAIRLAPGPVGARVAMGGAWMLLLAAIVLSFAAQAHVTDLLARSEEGGPVKPSGMDGVLGNMATAFLVAGLAMAGLAVLV